MNERVETNTGLILDALNALQQADAQLHGWTLTIKETDACQSLMLGQPENRIKVYQDRQVHETAYTAKLLVRSDDDSQVGTASGSLDPDSPITPQLERLKANAGVALNPYFEPAEPSNTAYPSVECADTAIVDDIQGAHNQLIDRINAHGPNLPDVLLNSAELFTNRHIERLMTSTGIDVQKATTDLYFEVAMEKAPGPNDQEVLKYWHFVSLDDAQVERCLDEVAQETALTLKAQLPPVREEAALLINSYAISKMMAALATRLDGSAEYSKGPHFLPGQSILTGERDKQSDSLTLTIDPTVALMAKSSPFTSDGLPAHAATVIRDSQVQSQTLDSRMAQYLDKPANHIYGNLVVDAGHASKADLLSARDEVFEILDFSSLRVNPTSLTWSSEIKLGLWHRAGQAPTVIKGGVVSGDLKTSFGAFRFSEEATRRNATGGYFEAANGYIGPEYMLTWQGITIAGEQETK